MDKILADAVAMKSERGRHSVQPLKDLNGYFPFNPPGSIRVLVLRVRVARVDARRSHVQRIISVGNVIIEWVSRNVIVAGNAI